MGIISDIPPKWNDIRSIADMNELSEIVDEGIWKKVHIVGFFI